MRDPLVSGWLGNDHVTTASQVTSAVTYDGERDTDRVTLTFTIDQYNALTAEQKAAVTDYVANPTGKVLTLPGLLTARNFEAADIQFRGAPPPPTTLAIVADSANQPEGDSGTTAFTFTVARTGSDLNATTTVHYTVAGGGAAQATADDFAGNAFPSGTVTFAAGESSRTVTIEVQGDTVAEADETFTATLSNPSNGTLTTAAAFGTIQNDDAFPPPPPPTLAIAAVDAVQVEGNAGSTAFTFTVTRTGDLSGASTVAYAVGGSGASPADAADFGGGLPVGTVSFAANEASQTITVNVSGDTTVEPNEGFAVTLSNPANATITTGTAAGIIQNDDVPPPELAIASLDALRVEGDAGSTAFTFTVTRSGDLTGASTVAYAVTGSGTTPADVADFGGSLPSGTVSFASNEASQTITVNVSGDTAVEPNEGFTITLSNPTNASIATATASGTIENDDALPPPTLAITATDAAKAEGNTGSSTAFTFTVTRSGDLSAASSATYAVTGSGTSPADAADFGGTLPSGTVSFAADEASQTITVDVSGDTTVEPNEGFTVTLANPANASIATEAAFGTIQNDDAPPPPSLAIAADDAVQAEGDGGSTTFTFTVTRSGDLSGTSAAAYAVVGSGTNPANANDFGGSLPSGTVSFASNEASQTITVSVRGDTAVEPDEGFRVTLSNPSNATITTATADGTIENDDPPPPGRVVTGGLGNDVLSGGPGNDKIFGLTGSDVLNGNAGDDVLFGGFGADTLNGDEGNDRLYGGIGDDRLFGGQGNDRLNGGLGDDLLDGGVGADTMVGGPGNDTYVVDNALDVVIEATARGIDTVQSAVSYALAANVENLTLTGTAINGTGNVFNNVLTGNAAANILDGGGGTDRLIGALGNDTYRLGRGYGADTVVENDATTGNSDVAQFLAGVAADQIWFARPMGTNTLEVSIIGTGDKLIIDDWYAGTQHHVEQFKTTDSARTLLDSNVENLVNAMAAFAPPAAAQTTLPPDYQATLAPVIAANWQ